MKVEVRTQSELDVVLSRPDSHECDVVVPPGTRWQGDLKIEGFSLRSLDVSNAEIGSLYATGAKIGGSLYAINATIAGSLYATGAKIGGSLYARNATIAGSLRATDVTIFEDLEVVGAKIGGILDAITARIGGILDASGAKIAGSLYTGGATICGAMFATGAKIDGCLNTMAAEITGGLHATGATIAGRRWEDWICDPLAGICDEPEARERAIAAWGNHSWHDCPMHAAHGWMSEDDAPEDKRRLVSAFVELFDSGLLPKPDATR